MASATWLDVLRESAPGRHVGHVYRDDDLLAAAVAAWFGRALRQGGSALLFGRPEKTGRILARLAADGVDVDEARRLGRLFIAEADEFMGRFMDLGIVDAGAFGRLTTHVIELARAAAAPGAEVRAWGEMVSMLRERGDVEAARALERVWAETLHRHGIALLCSYTVSGLDPKEQAETLELALEHHHRVITLEE